MWLLVAELLKGEVDGDEHSEGLGDLGGDGQKGILPASIVMLLPNEQFVDLRSLKYHRWESYGVLNVCPCVVMRLTISNMQ